MTQCAYCGHKPHPKRLCGDDCRCVASLAVPIRYEITAKGAEVLAGRI